MVDTTFGRDVAQAFSNEFGAVQSDRIALYAKKSWFGGGSLEELPIRHVTSVRLETSRSVFGSILLLIIGLGALYVGGGGIVVGLILAALGVVLLLGWPAVTINTAGNDLRRMTGTIFSKPAAEAYVTAVRKALFAKP
ncbi:MAG TPA: hypothetical protein VHW69_01785 [Rhizomicrobium sp.]|jgi:acyl-CoA synthetase (AMP-forming)/AMP-acid ligase II|nr:hypothetical protein [Rhizomicrobium sp.]